MKVASALPTVFAKNIAMGVDLLPQEQNRKNHSNYDHMIATLGAFQQLAVVGNFDSAMLAYSFMSEGMTTEQTQALEIIHGTTKEWLYGHITGELLNQLSSKLLSGRDKKEISETIIQCMEGQHGEGKVTTETMTGLLVRLTK